MKILIFYSGGKDSQACLIWACKKYGVDNCEAVFLDTGWENLLTYEHIKTTTDQLGVKLVTLKPKKYLGFIDLVKLRKTFPSTKRRFCTEELKIKPAIDYVLGHKENLIIIEGIRKDESDSRSKMSEECMYFKYYFQPYKFDKNGKPIFHTYRSKEVRVWCKEYDASKFRPMFFWTAIQTILFIKENNQTPNPLYFLGFKRVGCFPCIQCALREVKLIIELFPERWSALKSYELEYKTTFFPPDYIPKHACTTRDKKGNVVVTLEDVERYVKRKDATLDMFESEKPSCMSVYNLCE